MSFYDSALNRLHEVHDYCEKSDCLNFSVSRDTLRSLPSSESRKMKNDFKIMEDEGWIVSYAQSVGTPFSFTLTAEGIRVAEERLYASMEEFSKLVKEHESDSSTQEEILSVLKSIFEKMDDKKPLDPGILKQLNTYLQNSSWLSGPLTNLVITYLLK